MSEVAPWRDLTEAIDILEAEYKRRDAEMRTNAADPSLSEDAADIVSLMALKDASPVFKRHQTRRRL